MKLIDAFPLWMTEGFIRKFGEWTPWDEDEGTDQTALDLEYFGNRSGYKETSPLLDKMTCGRGDVVLSDVEQERLISIIQTMFGDAWSRQWEAVKKAYEPLDNYNMSETRTPNLTEKFTTNDKIATNIDSTVNTSGDMKTEQKVRPINSSSLSTVSASQQDAASNSVDVHTTGNIDDNYTVDLKDQTKTNTGTEKLVRSGNIGVTTSMQMLLQELEGRKKHFFDIVFDDIDSVLTSQFYTMRGRI